MNYKIVNTNYVGRVLQDVDHLKFRQHPTMAVIKCEKGTLIVFKNKKCRLMGVKGALLTLDTLPIKIQLDRIASRTVVFDYGATVNLLKFKNYEPEIFPAAPLYQFRPLNVNIFASGKVVVTGVKCKNCKKLVHNIREEIDKVVMWSCKL